MHRIPTLFRKCGIPYMKTCTKCKAASIYLLSTMLGPSLSITTHAKLRKVLQCFIDVDITAYTFLTLFLNEPTYNDHPCTKDLLGNSSNLFATFLKHPKSSDKTWAWASNLIKRKYSQDIWDLANIVIAVNLFDTRSSTFNVPRRFKGITTIWIQSQEV